MSEPSLRSPLQGPPPLIPQNSVLLDFDGTLVDLADRPDAVLIDPELCELMQALAQTFCDRVALISGRSIAQLEDFLGSALKGLAIVGSHGAEVQGSVERVAPDRPLALVAAELAIRAMFEDQEGVIIEVKTLGVAVHYRLAPAKESTAHTLVHRLAADSGLAVQEGKMMIELRVAGHDKGSGIAALMEQPSFAGSVPIFAGDDITDEPGFAAVARFGGFGVLVGSERPSAARYRLDNVAAVRSWLTQAI